MSDHFDYDVFISHSSKDKPVVRELANRLKKDGLRVWLDEWETQPGDMIGLKISQGMERSRTLLMVMSQAYFASEWSTLEHHTLLFRDPTNAQRRFIPVLIENCKLPDVVAQFAYIDWRQKSNEAYAKLLAACRSVEKPVAKSPFQKKRKEQQPDQAVMVLKGHCGAVTGVAVTPDGRKVVSSSADNTVKVWDLASGKCLASFMGHTHYVFGVVVTPDGKKVVSGSHDQTLKVWNIESGECLATLEGHTNEVKVVAITPDGKKIVSGSADRTVKVWDLESGQCLVTCEGHTHHVFGVAVTPDGKKVVSGSTDQTVKVWDLASSQCLATLLGHTDRIIGVAVTPDGKKVVSGSFDKTLKVWDLESGQCLVTMEGHTGDIIGVAITPDGKNIVSSSLDHSLRLWNIESGERLAIFTGLTAGVNLIAITPGGKEIISSSYDNTVRVWKLPDVAVPITPSQTARYTNAQIVLVGESGVGKTGLAIHLVEDRWEVTDSTHGMRRKYLL